MGREGTFEGMARIALNGRLLVPGKLEGIGVFTWKCLQELVRQRPNDEFLLVVDQPHDAMFELGPNVEVRRMPIPGRRPWLLKLWFGWPLRVLLRRWNADVFISLEGPLALGMPASFPQLTVIHDLNFEHHPEWLPPRWARYYRTQFPRFAAEARRVVTVSDASARDLADSYGLPRKDISVVPNAADRFFIPLADLASADVRKRHTGGERYFVFVGSLHPRKNIEGLLNAFGQYVDRGGLRHLVIVGAAMWDELPMDVSPSVRQRIHSLGRLPHDELPKVMGAAEALVFVPWFEGFGIPVLEAMACGVPVIASNVTSLPEVCGDAALALVSPGNPEEIAQAMWAAEHDLEARTAACERGMERAKHFSWAASGQALNRLVDDMLDPSKPGASCQH